MEALSHGESFIWLIPDGIKSELNVSRKGFALQLLETSSEKVEIADFSWHFRVDLAKHLNFMDVEVSLLLYTV